MELYLSIISLALSIGIGIYNIRLNKKIYGPKIRVIFERVYEHDEYGNYIEGRYTHYNVSVTNESISNIYDFAASYEFYDGDNNIVDYHPSYIMGIFKESVPCFVPGQKYHSYYENFKDLKNYGIRKIGLTFKYRINRNSRKFQKEDFFINIIPLSDNSILRIKTNI